jgi:hypothetical protein
LKSRFDPGNPALTEWPFADSGKWAVGTQAMVGNTPMLACYLSRETDNSVHFFIEDEDYFILSDYIDEGKAYIALKQDLRYITCTQTFERPNRLLVQISKPKPD